MAYRNYDDLVTKVGSVFAVLGIIAGFIYGLSVFWTPPMVPESGGLGDMVGGAIGAILLSILFAAGGGLIAFLIGMTLATIWHVLNP
jgi:hypothetical protein